MRPTDISERLYEVAARMPSWNPERFQAALTAIAESQSGLLLDWEAGDEAWARFLEGDDVVALLRESAPLAIIVGSSPSAASVMGTLREHDIVFIQAESWDAKELRLEDPESRMAIGLGWEGYHDSTDLASFSVSDLWYETLE